MFFGHRSLVRILHFLHPHLAEAPTPGSQVAFLVSRNRSFVGTWCDSAENDSPSSTVACEQALCLGKKNHRLLLQQARSVMAAFCRAFCTNLRSRREADSPYSWFVCFCAFFIIAWTLGTALNFGILFPVLMDYFYETRERTGK